MLPLTHSAHLFLALSLQPAGSGPAAEATPAPADAAAATDADEAAESGTEPAAAPSPAASEPAEGAAAIASDDAGPDAGGGELSMDDIFGAPEDNTAVEDGDAAGAGDAPAAGGSVEGPTTEGTARRRRLDALDWRLRLVSSLYYDVEPDPRGFSRNENRLEFTLTYTPSKHLQIVGNIEPVMFGIAQPRELQDLSTQQLMQPFHIESRAAYVGLYDIARGVDLKLGRQIVVWGSADRFNPTNNINPDDLEDRILFTDPIANQMAVLDVAPWGDKVWLQAVYVPLFYPALLPPSAALSLKDPKAPVPFANQAQLDDIQSGRQLAERSPRLEPEVISSVITPRPSFANSQAAAKLGWKLWEFDFSVSYYYGRHDIPVPTYVATRPKTSIEQPVDAMGNPIDEEGNAITGEDLRGKVFLSDVQLEYPRMQVVGADFAAQLPFAGNMGLWGEAALIFPERKDFTIEFPTPTAVASSPTVPLTEVSGPGIRSEPFVKATVGADYTFGKHVYVQAQYLRGLIDDFGVDFIGNYVAGGTDVIFLGRSLIFRVFTVVDLPQPREDDIPGIAPVNPAEPIIPREDTVSAVLFPEIIYVPPWGFVTFELGGLVFLSQQGASFDQTQYTKFGQRAVGSSIVFFKLAATF